jgi:hypothetical protein
MATELVNVSESEIPSMTKLLVKKARTNGIYDERYEGNTLPTNMQ